ncbi:MAG TPA: Sec-independent protein translocase subunit TatC, partial [Rhodanobacteraceae bacterium]|nr:Sec-independent protein translocase subunit TatC [Rhodanobacteraceae bacterium]
MSAEPDPDATQGLLSHLIELRSRLLKIVVTVLAVLVVLIPFANRLYT